MNGKIKLIWPLLIGPLVLMALLFVSPAMQAAATSAAKPAGADGGHYHFGFEDSIKPWASIADGALNYSLTRIAGDNGCADMFGGIINNHYAHLSSDQSISQFRPSVPATWMVAPLQVGLGEYQVTVEWSARLDNTLPALTGSDGISCQTCNPVAYVGANAPASGAQLKIADQKTPLDKSWHTYKYQAVVAPGEKGIVFVALGWNGTGMSIGVDCVDVTMNAILSPDTAR